MDQERTAPSDRQWQGSLLLGAGHATYVGPVGDTDEHAHHAVQICVGVDAEVRIWTAGAWGKYQGVTIGSGVRHRMAGGSGRVALLYLEPESIRGSNLAPKGGGIARLGRPLVRPLRIIAEGITTASELRAKRDGHRRLVEGLRLESFTPRVADPRIVRSLAAVRETPARFPTVSSLAKHAGLSASRFRELFTEHVAVSCRRYLVWMRLRRAVAVMSQGKSLTRAAHEADFADSAHLARVFRAMFGIKPSTLSRGVLFLS